MKTIAMIAGMVVLAGCAGGIPAIKKACDEQPDVPSVAACLKNSVAQRSVKPSEETKLYLLTAEQIAERVKRGELSELDGRVALQRAYVEWDRAMDENLATPVVVAPQPRQPIRCTTWGNQTTCR